MPWRARRLLRGEITYSVAKGDETNILQKLTYVYLAAQFRNYLHDHRSQIAALVADHVGLCKTGSCHIAPMNEWINGTFNICVPVTFNIGKVTCLKPVLLRFPLPYKVGESSHPGNSDEKLRCEAATYMWITKNCPDIPIPRLWSFGYSTGRSWIAVENAPIFTRWFYYLKTRWLSLLRHPLPSPYVRHLKPHSFKVGFLLMDYIEEADGQMLSETWEEYRHDEQRRENLFRSLSNTILSLSRIPLPRIGSFTIDDAGYISLTNRPLTLELQQLENEGIPVDITRDRTYATTESYFLGLLNCHRNRLIHQPNATRSKADCMSQMSALTLMSAIMGRYTKHELDEGPFFLTLTDLHPSNIFVDENWHITKIIDLEWACAQPLEMQHPPHWLTSSPVDAIDINAYDTLRREFMKIFTEQEEKQINEMLTLQSNDDKVNCSLLMRRSKIIQQGWENGSFWYCLALESLTGLHGIFYDHIQPRYASSHAEEAEYYQILSQYWDFDAQAFIERKLRDKKNYDECLAAAFQSEI